MWFRTLVSLTVPAVKICQSDLVQVVGWRVSRGRPYASVDAEVSGYWSDNEMHTRTLDGRVPGGLLSVKPGLEEVRLEVLVGPKIVSHAPRALIIVLSASLA
jgi:hypothetical protein